MKTIFSILTFFSACAFAVSETHLKDLFYSDVVPVLTQNSKSEFFIGNGGKRIHYFHYKVENPSAVLVLVPGRGEPAMKLAEMVYDLKDAGVDIFVIDHRGHGESDRLTSDPYLTHVDSFADYVDDLTYLIRNIVKPKEYGRSVLFGHSMGGAISAGFLKNYPQEFSRVVLSAPMFKIETKPYSEYVALKFAHGLVRIGRGMKYAPMQKPYDFELPFEKNTTSNSITRYNLQLEFMNKNRNLPVGGSSVKWVETSLKFTKSLRQTPNLFRVPTVIIQAGDDEWVRPEGQKQVCDLSPSRCRIVRIDGAKHEIYTEKDQYRNPYMTIIREALVN